MENILSENLIYVKVKQVAEALNKTVRTIQLYCKADKYEYRIVNGNGGQQYEILFTSLEPEIQAKLRGNNEYKNQICKVNNSIGGTEVSPLSKNDTIYANTPFAPHTFALTLSNSNQAVLSKTEMITLENYGLINTSNDNHVIPKKAKEKALCKIDLIRQWQNYRKGTNNKTKADKDFIKMYNENKYSEKIFKILGKVSLKTLYRWNKTYTESGYDFTSLVEHYNYGCESQLITNLADIEKFLLLKYMLYQNRYSLSRAYELIVRELNAYGYEAKSLASYRHVWNFITRNYSDIVSIARNGFKHSYDCELPYIAKDTSRLKVADVITGDGHVLDFMVQNPENGKPCRATLIGFIDNASRDLVGYDIMITENTQVIASALRHAIMYLGKMPKVVHLDNGRAFKGKTFTGDEKVDLTQAGIIGIYEKLGIKTIFSKPYNSKGKGNVERFFEELTSSFSKAFPSYIGNTISNQPACLKRNEKFHKQIAGDFVPTIEDVKFALENWLNSIYRQRVCLNDKTKTIEEFVNENKGQGVDIDLLDDLMLVSEERQINRGAIRLFNTRYYADELVGLNQKVIAKYDMFDLSYVKVFSLKGQYLCKAERDQLIHPYAELLGTAKDLADYKAKQKHNEKLKKERTNIAKSAMKTLYAKEGYDFKSMVKSKQKQIKLEKETEKEYKINFAENINILEEREENTYTLDNYGQILENRKIN